MSSFSISCSCVRPSSFKEPPFLDPRPSPLDFFFLFLDALLAKQHTLLTDRRLPSIVDVHMPAAVAQFPRFAPFAITDPIHSNRSARVDSDPIQDLDKSYSLFGK
jgi:hypothetical protein